VLEGHIQLAEGQGALTGLAAVGVGLAVAAELDNVHGRVVHGLRHLRHMQCASVITTTER